MSSKVTGFRLFAASSLALAMVAAVPACQHRAPGGAAYGAFAESPSHGRVLADLKSARARLSRKGHNVVMQNDQDAAIAAIDRVTATLRKAAENADAGPDDAAAAAAAAPDAGDGAEGQLHQAVAELKAARAYVEQDARASNERDLRRKLLHDLGEAIRLTNSAIAAASRGS